MKTTSFELSKKIKELGIRHDTYFVWCKAAGDSNSEPYIISFDELARTRGRHDAICVACTLDELLEMLPWTLYLNGIAYYVSIDKCQPSKGYKCAYFEGLDHYNPDDQNNTDFRTLTKPKISHNCAEAAGELLCWCVENGYVKIGESC